MGMVPTPETMRRTHVYLSADRFGLRSEWPRDRGSVVSGVHVIHVRRAFIEDRANTRPALVDAFDDDELRLIALDGTRWTVQVADPTAVAAVIDESSATLVQGHRLALVNEGYRLVGLAFGPPEAPAQLSIVAVVNLDDSSIPTDGDQPGWRLVKLVAADQPGTSS